MLCSDQQCARCTLSVCGEESIIQSCLIVWLTFTCCSRGRFSLRVQLLKAGKPCPNSLFPYDCVPLTFPGCHRLFFPLSSIQSNDFVWHMCIACARLHLAAIFPQYNYRPANIYTRTYMPVYSRPCLTSCGVINHCATSHCHFDSCGMRLLRKCETDGKQ